jgi:cytochrome c biogenesis protein CcmG/thiol:disulfide interchange protein DsbE
MRRLIPFLLVALVALVACGSPGPVSSGPAVERIDGPMPSLEGEALLGGSLSPGEYAGRVIVVNFWATWCGPCRREQPILSSAHAAGGDRGPFFVGVDYRDDAAAARAYLQEFDVRYPSLLDEAGDLAYRFGVPFLPTTVIVDAEGNLRFRVTGEIDAATLRDLVARASSPGGPEG